MKLFKKKEEGKGEETTEKLRAADFTVVVFDGSEGHDWPALFNDVAGSRVRVLQVSWMDCQVTVYGESGAGALLAMLPIKDSYGECVSRKKSISIRPDLLVVRNQPRGPYPNQDRKNVLLGLLMADIPSINSLSSIYQDLERPAMVGELRKIHKRLGDEAFPLIPINYYSNSSQMVIPPEPFPIVLKISHAHAGQGKIKISDGTGWNDMRTVIVLHEDHLTAEPFFPCQYGIRVQKVFDTVRVYRKNFTGSGWKSQFGGADLADEEVTPEYRAWAEAASEAYGGLDLLAIDALVAEDGSKVIIELNTTAIGIVSRHWQEDSRTIVLNALRKLDELEEAAKKRAALTSSTKTRRLKAVGEGEVKK